MSGGPRPLRELPAEDAQRLHGVFCDIDDTLTHRGRLVPEAFAALARLKAEGLRVVPVTGRPGGWVDHLARMWPVDAVVGENGGLWFRMADGRLLRRFAQSPEERRANRARLERLARRILREVPGCALASDQPYRELDLAIDWCEDVPPLPEADVDRIVALFEEAGARCKVSSIHVNGWFGDFDKLSGCRALVREAWGEDLDATRDRWAFFGDSGNDAPMFAAFPVGIGVANVRRFLHRMSTPPRWITEAEGGEGFAEGVDRLLALRADGG